MRDDWRLTRKDSMRSTSDIGLEVLASDSGAGSAIAMMGAAVAGASALAAAAIRIWREPDVCALDFDDENFSDWEKIMDLGLERGGVYFSSVGTDVDARGRTIPKPSGEPTVIQNLSPGQLTAMARRLRSAFDHVAHDPRICEESTGWKGRPRWTSEQLGDKFETLELIQDHYGEVAAAMSAKGLAAPPIASEAQVQELEVEASGAAMRRPRHRQSPELEFVRRVRGD